MRDSGSIPIRRGVWPTPLGPPKDLGGGNICARAVGATLVCYRLYTNSGETFPPTRRGD